MCWCSAKRAVILKKKAVLLPLFFLLLSPLPPLLSSPLLSSVEMKDRHWGGGGQALAQLSNHYFCAFSSCRRWQVICQQAAGSGLSIRAVAHEYFSAHTYTPSSMHHPAQTFPSPSERSMLPAPCIICHTAALSLMSLSGLSSSSSFLLTSHPLLCWLFPSFNAANLHEGALPTCPPDSPLWLPPYIGNDRSRVLYSASGTSECMCWGIAPIFGLLLIYLLA